MSHRALRKELAEVILPQDRDPKEPEGLTGCPSAFLSLPSPAGGDRCLSGSIQISRSLTV